MFVDARRLKYDRRDIKGIASIAAIDPMVWLIAGVFVFPIYISCRPMLREAGRRRQAAGVVTLTERLPPPSVRLFLGAFAVSVLTVVTILWGSAFLFDVFAPTLPECSSAAVTEAVEKALSHYPALHVVEDLEATDEVRSKLDPPRRVCRTPVRSATTNDTLYFAVEWQQLERRIFQVRLLGNKDDGK